MEVCAVLMSHKPLTLCSRCLPLQSQCLQELINALSRSSCLYLRNKQEVVLQDSSDRHQAISVTSFTGNPPYFQTSSTTAQYKMEPWHSKGFMSWWIYISKQVKIIRCV